MSKKLFDTLKMAKDLTKKIEDHLDKAVKLATNANSHLEFGTEGCKTVYQIIVVMQKKGAKGDKVGDYKNAEIPKFLKEVADCKTRLTTSIKANNDSVKTGLQFQKMASALDGQIVGFAKDKEFAKNPAAVKILMDSRKQILKVEQALNDFVNFGSISETQPRFIDVTASTKVDDLKSKLPMAFQKSVKDWETAGAKYKTSFRAFREVDFDTSMRLAAQLAG